MNEATMTARPTMPDARNQTTLHVLQALDAAPDILAAGAQIEVVGAWVWVSFPAKPEQSVRAEMSALGFRFNRRRMVWQHACGKRSRRSRRDPRATYGARRYRTGAAGDEE